MVLPYTEFPPVLRQALISIEDKTFERNWGVNLIRAVGAAWRDLHSRSRAQGSSTLTMQLARNLFLSNEKTYGRKLQEVLLSMQIERVFTKDQIFQRRRCWRRCPRARSITRRSSIRTGRCGGATWC